MDEKKTKTKKRDAYWKSSTKSFEQQPMLKLQKQQINYSRVIVNSVAALAVAVTVITSMVACGKINGDLPHTHSFGEWSTAKEATCEENGIKERYCDCGEKQTDDIFASGHKFGEWIVVEQPTCVDEGTEKRECSCGERETRAIDKINTHSEAIDAAVEPTCDNTGLTEGKHCSECGNVIVEQTVIPATGHKYDDRYDADCNVCDFVRPADCRHNNTVIIPGKSATCTGEGYTEGEKCANCEEVLIPQIQLDPLGHTEGKWIVDKESTCTEDGIKSQSCSVCSVTLNTEIIKAIGHSISDWIYEKQPTCTEDGTRYKHCLSCKVKFEEEQLSATGHNYESYICTKCVQPQAGVKLVYDREDLNNIRNNLGATYVLMNDIDCYGFAIVPIGASEATPFTGIFDGRGYTISNYQLSGEEYIGMFGVNAGTIKNLNVQTFSINLTSSSSAFVEIGGIAGRNSGTIEKCSATKGDIYVSLHIARWAGLICGASTGSIRNCYATGNVYVTQDEQNTKWAYVGGVTSHNSGTIENCFVDAIVYAYGYNKGLVTLPDSYRGEVALIAGVNSAGGKIHHCFAMGNVTGGNGRVGDISGFNNGTITECYRDSNAVLASSRNNHTYATSLPIGSMSSNEFFNTDLNWDSSIWSYDNVDLENKVYPTLIQN